MMEHHGQHMRRYPMVEPGEDRTSRVGCPPSAPPQLAVVKEHERSHHGGGGGASGLNSLWEAIKIRDDYCPTARLESPPNTTTGDRSNLMGREDEGGEDFASNCPPPTTQLKRYVTEEDDVKKLPQDDRRPGEVDASTTMYQPAGDLMDDDFGGEVDIRRVATTVVAPRPVIESQEGVAKKRHKKKAGTTKSRIMSKSKKVDVAEPKKNLSVVSEEKKVDVVVTKQESIASSSISNKNNEEVVKEDKTTVITTVEENDVLSGRGGGTNHNEGNVRFRDLVKFYQPLYVIAPKHEKRRVSMCIVSAVRNTTPPGRFLELLAGSKTTTGYVEIGDRRAWDKTSQSLREGAPEVRRSPLVQRAIAALRVRGGRGGSTKISSMINDGAGMERMHSVLREFQRRDVWPPTPTTGDLPTTPASRIMTHGVQNQAPARSSMFLSPPATELRDEQLRSLFLKNCLSSLGASTAETFVGATATTTTAADTSGPANGFARQSIAHGGDQARASAIAGNAWPKTSNGKRSNRAESPSESVPSSVGKNKKLRKTEDRGLAKPEVHLQTSMDSSLRANPTNSPETSRARSVAEEYMPLLRQARLGGGMSVHEAAPPVTLVQLQELSMMIGNNGGHEELLPALLGRRFHGREQQHNSQAHVVPQEEQHETTLMTATGRMQQRARIAALLAGHNDQSAAAYSRAAAATAHSSVSPSRLGFIETQLLAGRSSAGVGLRGAELTDTAIADLSVLNRLQEIAMRDRGSSSLPSDTRSTTLGSTLGGLTSQSSLQGLLARQYPPELNLFDAVALAERGRRRAMGPL